MGKVRAILGGRKGVFSVSPESTVHAALVLMAEKNTGSVLVTSEDGKLVGIFTERDYARKVNLKGRSSNTTAISEVMTANPFTVSMDTTIEQCMGMMSGKKIRHLPVVNGEELIGVISISDVIRFIIDEQKEIIEQLEHYITGH
jgi:CBS domain-containing protein